MPSGLIASGWANGDSANRTLHGWIARAEGRPRRRPGSLSGVYLQRRGSTQYVDARYARSESVAIRSL